MDESFTPPGPAVERWLPVPEWAGLYEVSDRGRVRSLDRTVASSRGNGQRMIPGRILRPTAKGTGKYLMVTLSKDDQPECVYVHNLVLTAFVGPRPPGIIEARHGVAGRHDNSLANLCWGTMQENHQDRTRDNAVTWGERHGNAKLTAAGVRDCRRRFAAGEKLCDLAREYGVSKSGLSQAVNGVTWPHL